MHIGLAVARNLIDIQNILWKTYEYLLKSGCQFSLEKVVK